MKVKKIAKSFFVILLSGIIALSAIAPSVYAAVIEGKTGIGMAEWAFRAYNEGWTYKYGGSSAGEVDCSGLIRSYCNGKGGGAKALLNASTVNGSTDDMPRIHGLGLWCEGHAGVYVGKNKDGTDMAIDMRNSKVNVVYSAMSSRRQFSTAQSLLRVLVSMFSLAFNRRIVLLSIPHSSRSR